MKALITGGAGFIGSHLAEELLKKGRTVYVLDNLSTGNISNIAHLIKRKKFTFTKGDILNRALTRKLVDRVDEVYHLAAAVGVKFIIDNPLKSIQINVDGTKNILESASSDKKRVVIASTSEIYGKAQKSPYHENDDRLLGTTTISRWSYSCTKALDEFLGLAFYREKGLPVIIVRLFNTCGPRQTGAYGMVIPRFISQALSNKPITVYGNGMQTRSFTHVKDVVEGITGLSRHPGAIGEVFNIGRRSPITIQGLARKIKRITKSSSRIIYIPYNKAYAKNFEDMQNRTPDTTKIRKLTGWKPAYSLDEVLKEIIENCAINRTTTL